MSEKGQNSQDRYSGCRMFISPNGRSGFVLGAEGDKAGWLYDFFVGLDEPKNTADELMKLAVRQGARQLVTYEHPFLECFYLRHGFESKIRFQYAQLKDPPEEWVPDLVAAKSFSCPDFLCMVRKDEGTAAKAIMSESVDFASRPGTEMYDECCAGCGRQLPALSWLRILRGYYCFDCGFLHVHGSMLTLTVWDRRSDSTSKIAPSASPSRVPQTTIFSSGLDLLQH